MSEAENRDAANLLILCITHADAVDQRDLVDRYPIDLLHEWKLDQVALYDKAVREAAENATVGLQLTDEEATEVINKSETPTPQIVIHGDINNGGQGGVNGGAGGGGGVMSIGSGVVNGYAGPGGQTRIRINNDGQPGIGYGSGGGGGGSSWLAPIPMPAREGSEGYGYAVLCQADRAVLGPCSADRTLSDRFGASALLLVSSAKVEEGLVNMSGGAWQNFTVKQKIPETIEIPVFAVVEAGGVPSGVYSVRIEVTNPAGELRGDSELAYVVEESGEIVRTPIALDIRTVVDAYGIWGISVSTEIARLASTTFMVKPHQN